jgi:hypothetical protein
VCGKVSFDDMIRVAAIEGVGGVAREEALEGFEVYVGRDSGGEVVGQGGVVR